VVGVLLVLVAVVVGARLFASADHQSAVFVARHALVPGEHVVAADLTVGHVRFDGQGGRYVAAGAAPVGYVVTRYVGAEEMIPVAALSASAPTVANSRFVTVPVAPGHLPDGLAHGDLVDIYLTPKATGSRGFSGTATESVVLSVPSGIVRSVVHAVESGTIDLARVPVAPSGVLPTSAGSTAAP
jgi:hypothetical protein